MNPKAVLAIAAAVIVVVVLLAVLIDWRIRRSAGINRVRTAALQRDRDLALNALRDIYDKALPYSDFDNVLAMDVRTIYHQLQQKRLELPK